MCLCVCLQPKEHLHFETAASARNRARVYSQTPALALFRKSLCTKVIVYVCVCVCAAKEIASLRNSSVSSQQSDSVQPNPSASFLSKVSFTASTHRLSQGSAVGSTGAVSKRQKFWNVSSLLEFVQIDDRADIWEFLTVSSRAAIRRAVVLQTHLR